MKEQMECIHGGDVYTEGILKGRELIDFSSNINPLGVPKSFRDNIEEALSRVTRYPDVKYRELIGYLKQYVMEGNKFCLSDDCFLLGNGAAEVIDLAISSFKKLLIVVPSFAEYEEDAVKWDCNITYSYLNEHMEYDYEDIYSKLHQVDALVIANPNNPSGNIIDKRSFHKVINFCEENNKTIIIDEAFVEFTGEKEQSFINDIDSYKCLFIIRALTKFFALPGIRLGFGVSKNIELINKLKKRQNPWNINCFAETAAKYVLRDKEYIYNSLKWIEAEKSFLPEMLREIPFIESVYNTNSNYVLCKLKGISGEELYNLCMEQGILIRRARNFKGLDDRFVRFAIKDRELNLKLLEVLMTLR